jgi:hypothetical protein
MNEVPQPQHPVLKIARFFPIVEKIVLPALAIGVLLDYSHFNGKPIILICLPILAIVFFLGAFVPLELPERDQPYDFSHLLVFMIMPKVVGIASAISILGIFFYLLDLGNKGYLQLLMNGASVTFAAFAIYLYGVIKSMEGVSTLLPLFYRAIPFAILATYIFIQNRS